MSRNRVQIFMLVSMLFHCGDFAQKPKSSIALHVSFDVAHLLQTQRAESLTHSWRSRQLVSLNAQHRAPSNATFVQQVGRVIHFHVRAAPSISKPSFALVHLSRRAAFQTVSALSFVCHSCLAYPWRCRGPTDIEACGVLPQSQSINRSRVSVPAVLRGWCWLNRPSSHRSATEPRACGVLPRQRNRAPLLARQKHLGDLCQSRTPSSKQGLGLDTGGGDERQLRPSIGMRLGCCWQVRSNNCTSEARRFLGRDAFQNSCELRCVYSSCPALPQHCRGPTGIADGATLPWSQCISRPHILGTAVHRGPDTQLTSPQVCRPLINSSGRVKSLRNGPRHSGCYRLEHSSSYKSAPQRSACGGSPRQRSKTPPFLHQTCSGDLRQGETSSRQGLGLGNGCGGVPQLWPSIGVRLGCRWQVCSNNCTTEARQLLRHAAFQTSCKLRCVCPSCPAIPQHCRELTGTEAGNVLLWNQCNNRLHILGPAVIRGPGHQPASLQVHRSLRNRNARFACDRMVCSGCCKQERSGNHRPVARLRACGVSPRQKSRASQLMWPQRSGALWQGDLRFARASVPQSESCFRPSIGSFAGYLRPVSWSREPATLQSWARYCLKTTVTLNICHRVPFLRVQCQPERDLQLALPVALMQQDQDESTLTRRGVPRTQAEQGAVAECHSRKRNRRNEAAPLMHLAARAPAARAPARSPVRRRPHQGHTASLGQRSRNRSKLHPAMAPARTPVIWSARPARKRFQKDLPLASSYPADGEEPGG